MADPRRMVRNKVLGLSLGLAVVIGASACGSGKSAKPATQVNSAPASTAATAATTTPTTAKPATTKPSGGGVSY